MKATKRKKPNATGRSDVEQFVPLPYTMLHHPAWRDLSGTAIKLFLELRSRFNGHNNGDLSVSYAEVRRLLGIGRTTASRAFAELEVHGFIVKVKQRQWYGRTATTWRVTDKPCRGSLATRDWQAWRPASRGSSAARSEPGMVLQAGSKNRNRSPSGIIATRDDPA